MEWQILMYSLAATATLAATACFSLHRIWRRRDMSLRKQLKGLSDNLLQLTELQIDMYRKVTRSVSEIEERMLELSMPFPETVLPLERRHQVMALSRKGMPVEEIAKRLNLPKGEAELIIKLRRYLQTKGAAGRDANGGVDRCGPISATS